MNWSFYGSTLLQVYITYQFAVTREEKPKACYELGHLCIYVYHSEYLFLSLFLFSIFRCSLLLLRVPFYRQSLGLGFRHQLRWSHLGHGCLIKCFILFHHNLKCHQGRDYPISVEHVTWACCTNMSLWIGLGALCGIKAFDSLLWLRG